MVADGTIQALVAGPEFTAQAIGQGQIVAVVSRGPVEANGQVPGSLVNVGRMEKLYTLLMRRSKRQQAFVWGEQPPVHFLA